MRFNYLFFIRSILLVFLFLTGVLHVKAENRHAIHSDSIAIQGWVKSIMDSVFYNPDVILPWLDSLSVYADSTQSPYANYAKNNLKGTYNWSIRRFDSAANYYRIANQWSAKGGLIQEQIKSYGNLGLVYTSLDNFDSSAFYYLRAIAISKQNSFNNLYVRNILNLSYLYNQKGNYADAVELLEEARILSESLNNEELNAMLYGAFGGVYYYLGDLNKMKYYYQHAIDYYIKVNNNSVLSILYMNIAESFSSITQNYDSSAYYFNKALEVSVPQNKDNLLNLIDLTRGNLYFETGQLDLATFYYGRALQNPLTEQYARRKTALLINMGNVFRVQRNYKNAVEYYKRGYQIADSLELVEYKSNALLGLVKIDSANGNFKQAFFQNLERQQIQKELKKDEARSLLMANEVERALEVQSLKNELLQSENAYQENTIENQRWLGGLIIFALFGVLLFTLVQFLNHKKIKNLNSLLEANVNRLDTQNTALDQLNKTKDKFFSIISHDLRSPFAAIRNASVMLNTAWEDFSDEERAEVLFQLDKSTENTHHLLEELLQWSQLQQGLMKLEEKSFSTVALINELHELFYSITSDKDIRLTIEFYEDVALTTDRQMLKQLLHNLLSNATKFTPRGGEIKIEVLSESRTASITVRDNGIGIPKEKQSGIFDLDSDFGRPGTEGEKSSGMGLILCMDYATLMGAKLELESEEGKGSAFTIVFDVS